MSAREEAEARRARLAAELRANIAKRKTQARVRAAADTEVGRTYDTDSGADDHDRDAPAGPGARQNPDEGT